MRAGFGLILAAVGAVLGGAGCCRLCHRWCDDRDDCRRPCQPARYYCVPAAQYAPECECPPEGDRIPPRRLDTRSSRYDDEPAVRPAARDARDDRPTGDPRYDRRPTGAYGGTGP